MSRPIKFRGKRVDNGEWVYGDLTQSYPEDYPPEIKVTTWTKDYGGYYATYPVIPESVGQFTGLYDKNGKEIYEGDIWSVGRSTGEIIYAEDGFKIQWIVDKNFYNDILRNHNKFGEIIGNIHDNPSLLEVQP